MLATRKRKTQELGWPMEEDKGCRSEQAEGREEKREVAQLWHSDLQAQLPRHTGIPQNGCSATAYHETAGKAATSPPDTTKGFGPVTPTPPHYPDPFQGRFAMHGPEPCTYI